MGTKQRLVLSAGTYVDLPDYTSPYNANFAIAFFIRVRSLPSSKIKAIGAYNGMHLNIDVDGTLTFDNYSTSVTFGLGGPVTLNTWYWVCFEGAPGGAWQTQKGTPGGSASIQASGTGGTVTGDYSLLASYIGYNDGGLQGEFDLYQLAFYDSSYTQTDLDNHRTKYLNSGTLPTSLARLYSFEGDTTQVTDNVGGAAGVLGDGATPSTYATFSATNLPAITDINVTSINGGADISEDATGVLIEYTGGPITSISIGGEAQSNLTTVAGGITFDVSMTSFGFGSQTITLSDGAASLDIAVNIVPASGQYYVTVGSYIEPDINARIQITDPQTGWQVEWDNSLVTIDSTLAYSGTGNQTFNVRYFDGSTWSAWQQYIITVSADTTAPTLLSATITANDLKLRFDEPVKVGVGDSAGWEITLSGGAATLTYASGSTSSILHYTISRTPATSETGTIAYTQPGSGIQDIAGNDLASIASESVNIFNGITFIRSRVARHFPKLKR